jgi:hypothetical protein
LRLPVRGEARHGCNGANPLTGSVPGGSRITGIRSARLTLRSATGTAQRAIPTGEGFAPNHRALRFSPPGATYYPPRSRPAIKPDPARRSKAAPKTQAKADSTLAELLAQFGDASRQTRGQVPRLTEQGPSTAPPCTWPPAAVGYHAKDLFQAHVFQDLIHKGYIIALAHGNR